MKKSLLSVLLVILSNTICFAGVVDWAQNTLGRRDNSGIIIVDPDPPYTAYLKKGSSDISGRYTTYKALYESIEQTLNEIIVDCKKDVSSGIMISEELKKIFQFGEHSANNNAAQLRLLHRVLYAHLSRPVQTSDGKVVQAVTVANHSEKVDPIRWSCESFFRDRQQVVRDSQSALPLTSEDLCAGLNTATACLSELANNKKNESTSSRELLEKTYEERPSLQLFDRPASIAR